MGEIKQVRFHDAENLESTGGILIDGGLICGCCGAFFPKNEWDAFGIVIEEVYQNWMNISAEITGD